MIWHQAAEAELLSGDGDDRHCRERLSSLLNLPPQLTSYEMLNLQSIAPATLLAFQAISLSRILKHS